MSEAFYSHARLYDLMFPAAGPAVEFYRAAVNRRGGCVLELGCGTGHKLIPIASDGHPCVGLDFSADMLAEAQRKASEHGVAVEWVQGDMRAFDLDRTFDFVFITANSLLHLHEAEDLVSCFRSVRRHLAPGGRFMFDVFNPNVRLLAEADGVRRTRESLSFTDPDRGDVSVDVAEIYDAPAQVTRGNGTSRPTPSLTSSPHRWKSGASSRRSCRCSSRSAACGSSSGPVTGPVSHLARILRFNSASASPRN
ncbi:class I SAM-dependent methyltransferase [Phytoactinopolyspora limicola]|uniref:class I SAM-dependent methyltransferase n=1 Tax=Phytoactinopolyspora limicola TaxID=2715536 RepID=UPI001A9C7E4F|nr:class I SAM-dependent methyltransferase [Phytoactinopolyspora limicola]